MNDGLSNDEKVKILFKNYMNFGSTSDGNPFYSETAFANNTNIFSDQIMSEKPSNAPTYTTATNTEVVNLLTTNTNLNIDLAWVESKTPSSDSYFEYADNILRFNKIKLDYLSGCAFICKDNNDNNVLQNLIPFNYGTGFGMELNYLNGNNEFKRLNWMDSKSDTQSLLGENVSWGAPLFDTKNGVITFYDVDTGNASSIFNGSTPPEFYLTATKYVGPMGINSDGSSSGTGSSFWDQNTATKLLIYDEGNVNVANDLTVGGTVTINGDLVDSSGIPFSSGTSGGTQVWDLGENNNISYTNGNVDISGNLTIGGNIITSVGGIQTDQVIAQDIQVDGKVDVSGAVTASTFYGDGSSLSGVVKPNENTTFLSAVTASSFYLSDGTKIDGSGTITSNIWEKDSSNNISYTTGAVYAQKFIGDGSDLSGVVILDTSNNINVYGDLRIMSGGNLIIDDNSGEITTSTSLNSLQFNGLSEIEVSNNPGTLRFNNTTNMFEYYTNEKIWNSLNTCKVEQPPYLKNVAVTRNNQTIQINWEKFDERFEDAYDGKIYPIYFQTYIDISFTNINNVSSNGWKTVYIGNGSCDISGNNTEHLNNFVFTHYETTQYTNNTSYDIVFPNKPETIDLPIFYQTDSFDIRLCAVNKSNKEPYYVYEYNISLKETFEPGPIEIIDYHDYNQNEFEVDLSFNLDKNDDTITSGIDIYKYDVSLSLVESRSLNSIEYSDVKTIVLSDISANGKSNIPITNLYPGAKYDIQLRAQNLQLPNVDGSYGNVQQSDEFTHISDKSNQYISRNDLITVNPLNMVITLNNSSSIYGYVSGINYLENKTILNQYGSININGISEFYVNSGCQGKDMIDVSGNILVVGKITKKINNTESSEIEFDFAATNPSSVTSESHEIFGYTFKSSDSYTDKGNVWNNPDISSETDRRNDGFVYSSIIEKATMTENPNTVFRNEFPASTNIYNIVYSLGSTVKNNLSYIDFSGNTNISISTGNFLVDDYIANTDIHTFTNSPTISIVSSETTFLFGIPSVHKVNLTAIVNISNFANNFIPHDSDKIHSFISEITTNSFTFPSLEIKNISSLDPYDINYSSETDVSSGMFIPNTICDFQSNVYVLNNTSTTPSVEINSNIYQTNDIGKLFKDIYTSYSEFQLYTFNGIQVGTNSLNTTYEIDMDTLLYFDGKFVSGGYNTSYHGETVYAFDNWKSKNNGGDFATNGPDYSIYSQYGAGNYKWIVLDVTNKIFSNRISLSYFEINGNHFSLSEWETDYKAYIYVCDSTDTTIKYFGTLKKNYNIADTVWYNQKTTTISQADNRNGAIYNNELIVDPLNSSYSYYLIVGLFYNKNIYFTFH